MLCGRWIRAGERSTDACYQPWQSYRDLQCSINLVNWIPNPDCWALGKKQTMLRELFCNAGLPVDTSTHRDCSGNLLLEWASMPSWKERLHLEGKKKKKSQLIHEIWIPQGELNIRSFASPITTSVSVFKWARSFSTQNFQREFGSLQTTSNFNVKSPTRHESNKKINRWHIEEFFHNKHCTTLIFGIRMPQKIKVLIE